MRQARCICRPETRAVAAAFNRAPGRLLVVLFAANAIQAFSPPFCNGGSRSFSVTSRAVPASPAKGNHKQRSSRSTGRSLAMHMGHHHHHHHDDDDHHHDHHHHDMAAETLTGPVGVLRYIISVIKAKKRSLLGVLLGAITVVAFRSYRGMRQFTSTDIGLLGVVATFALAVEAAKSYLVSLRKNVVQVVMAWRRHTSLRQMQNSEQGPTSARAEGAKEADRVTWLGIYMNLVLFVLKAAGGIFGNSAAMIADAGHTLSDLVSDAVTLWAVRMSSLPPDADHPYGHGRFEAVGSLGVSVLLLGTAWQIALHAYDKLHHTMSLSSISFLPWLVSKGGHVGHVHGVGSPGPLAVSAALASIIVKEFLYQATATVGLKHNSQVVMANAWHHRSDAISSVMALGGILAARAGMAALDPMAGILVTAMIGLTGMEIFLNSMSDLTDTVDHRAVTDVKRIVDSVEGVIDSSNIRARRMGAQMLVDLRIRVDPEASASAAQHVAEQVRWRVLRGVPGVSEVLVNTKTDPVPCPVATELRPPSEIETDVRLRIMERLPVEPHITAVGKVTVHYIKMQLTVEVLLQVDPKLTVSEASAVAKRVQLLVEGVRGLTSASIHLDLTSPPPFSNSDVKPLRDPADAALVAGVPPDAALTPAIS